jgi:hypothetical protein
LSGHQLRQAAGVRHLTNVSGVLSGAVATGGCADEAAVRFRFADTALSRGTTDAQGGKPMLSWSGLSPIFVRSVS